MNASRWIIWSGFAAACAGGCSQGQVSDGLAAGGTPSGGISSLTGGVLGTGAAPLSSGGRSDGGTGSSTGGAVNPSTGGALSSGGALLGTGGGGGAPAPGCSDTPWPAADPATIGPFETVTEMNVGPLAGEDENGDPTDYTIFRPKELGQDGHCHPIITWGNGTSSNPSLYKVLLNHLASHGFVVIGSNSPNVARGTPPPMLAGVTWLKEQNADPSSPYYGHLDVENVGATGHSQGGLATSTAGNDPSISTIAPLCGAGSPRSLSGPAFLFCGGQDTVATCESVERAFSAIDEQPAMLANYLEADHANWISFNGTKPKPVEVAVTAWMRVHLMKDTSLRNWFYGASCKLCTDAAWAVQQSMMDE